MKIKSKFGAGVLCAVVLSVLVPKDLRGLDDAFPLEDSRGLDDAFPLEDSRGLDGAFPFEHHPVRKSRGPNKVRKGSGPESMLAMPNEWDNYDYKTGWAFNAFKERGWTPKNAELFHICRSIPSLDGLKKQDLTRGTRYTFRRIANAYHWLDENREVLEPAVDRLIIIARRDKSEVRMTQETGELPPQRERLPGIETFLRNLPFLSLPIDSTDGRLNATLLP